MADPFIGEIRTVAFNYAPEGWMLCNGQVLNVNAYQALYALLGNTYGGTYPTTFGIPDLQGRSVIGVGAGLNLPVTQPGVKVGAASTQLSIDQMPPHNHVAMVSDPGHTHTSALPAHTHPFSIPCDNGSGEPGLASPVGNFLSNTSGIDANINVAIDDASAADTSGGGFPHISGTGLYSASGAGSMGNGTTGNPSATAAGPTGASATGIAVALQNTGGATPVPIQSPAMGLYFIIATLGIWPPRQ